jgi:hypothetical protein
VRAETKSRAAIRDPAVRLVTRGNHPTAFLGLDGDVEAFLRADGLGQRRQDRANVPGNPVERVPARCRAVLRLCCERLERTTPTVCSPAASGGASLTLPAGAADINLHVWVASSSAPFYPSGDAAQASPTP